MYGRICEIAKPRQFLATMKSRLGWHAVFAMILMSRCRRDDEGAFDQIARFSYWIVTLESVRDFTAARLHPGIFNHLLKGVGDVSSAILIRRDLGTRIQPFDAGGVVVDAR